MDNFGMAVTQAHKKAFIQITGMTCQSCVKTIQHKVGSLEGVFSVSVFLSNEEGIVVFAPSKISVETLIGEIEDTGFDASLKTIENLQSEEQTNSAEPVKGQVKALESIELDKGIYHNKLSMIFHPRIILLEIRIHVA